MVFDQIRPQCNCEFGHPLRYTLGSTFSYTYSNNGASLLTYDVRQRQDWISIALLPTTKVVYQS
jgi:hypothetical protein